MKNATFAEKALSFFVLLAIFAVPLVVFPGRLFAFVTSKSFFFMGVAEMVFFLWAYLAIVNSKYRLSKRQIIVFLIPVALLASLTISGILAPNSNVAFWSSFERGSGIIFLYHCLAFGIVVASLAKVHGKEFLTKIYKAVFYSGIILALSTFVSEKLINIPELFLFKSVNSADLSGNSSFSGAYLIFAAFLGALLLLEAKAKMQRFWLAFGLVVVLISPIAGVARGAIVGLLAGAIVAFFVYLATNAKKSIRTLGFSMLGLMLVVGAVIGVSVVQPSSKLHSAFVDAASNSRFVFWKAGVEGIKERPIFGFGPENFNIVFSKYFDTTILKSDGTAEVWVDKPHNVFLENLVAGGLIGGSLYILFVLALFALPIYLYRRNIISNISLAMFEGMFFAYFLQDMIFFDTIPNLVMLFTMFGLFTGSLFWESHDSRSKDSKYLSDSTKAITGLVLLVIFIISWVYLVNQPTRKSKALARILYNVNIVSKQNDFTKLTTISPMGNGNEAGLVGVNMLANYRKEVSNIIADPELIKVAQANIDAFLAEVDKLESVAKNNTRLWLASAELVAVEMTITATATPESVTRALAYVDHAEALTPGNPRIYWTRGRIYVSARDFKKAHESYRKAYDIDPEINLSQQYLTKFKEAFGSKLK